MGLFSWDHVVRGGETMEISLRGTTGTRNDTTTFFFIFMDGYDSLEMEQTCRGLSASILS